MKHILPAAAAHSSIFRVATLVLAIGIFGFDTFTLLEAAAAVLYVVVVLMSDGFCHRRGILFVAGGCMGLTVLSFMLTIAGYPATAAGSPIVGGSSTCSSA